MGIVDRLRERQKARKHELDSSPTLDPAPGETKKGKNVRAFKSCDDFPHPGDCDCGYCSVMREKALERGEQRQIRKTTSREGETIYYVTEYKKGSTVVYLVYPGEDAYSQIEREYDDLD